VKRKAGDFEGDPWFPYWRACRYNSHIPQVEAVYKLARHEK